MPWLARNEAYVDLTRPVVGFVDIGIGIALRGESYLSTKSWDSTQPVSGSACQSFSVSRRP